MKHDPEAQNYLLQIPVWTRQKNTLEQVRDFLMELGDPEQGLRIIHVAGTNGKGSVCADLTAILMEAGYQVGTFVSPHLTDIRERFLLNGTPLKKKRFQALFETVYPVVERMMGRGYCHPTFFEFLFLMAMKLFAEEQPDFVILETGLGGRLDTTNVIRRPEAAVITSIGLDHMQYLGDTIPQIAAEKAGIIKPQTVVIYDDNQSEASGVIAARAEALHVKAYPVSAKERYQEVDFPAPYQAMNAALAVKTLEVLLVKGVSADICRQGLEHVSWPGRMEQAAEDIWLDGAHNPHGVHAFLEAASRLQQKCGKNIHLLFAAVADKDYNEMIQMLVKELDPDRVTVVQLKSERGLNLKLLTKAFSDAGCMQVEGYDQTGAALKAALSHKSKDDRLFIVGSLYLIGEIKEELERKEYAGLRGRNQSL